MSSFFDNILSTIKITKVVQIDTWPVVFFELENGGGQVRNVPSDNQFLLVFNISFPSGDMNTMKHLRSSSGLTMSFTTRNWDPSSVRVYFLSKGFFEISFIDNGMEL